MSHNQKIIKVPIKGMHCKSCEILIEENLKEVEGVVRAEVDYRKGEAKILYKNNKPDFQAINKAVESAGYAIGAAAEEKSFFSKDKTVYKDLGTAFIWLFAIYFIAKSLGLTNMDIGGMSSDLTVPFILLVGLTAGVSTCMALVGGLVLGLSAKHNEMHPETTGLEKFRPHLLFNFGRVISYAFFGGFLGLIGSAFKFSAASLGFITIGVGIIMLIIGLQLIDIFPWIKNLKLTLPKTLGRALGLGKHQREYSHRGSFILGATTFFLPCGFTQAMQVYAIGTGNYLGGAIVMGAFALGTMPGLLGIGGLTSFIKGVFARKFFKFAGLAVIAFALFNISNGLGLAGLNFVWGRTGNVNINDPNVSLVDGVQIVKMAEEARGYVPNSFTIRQGVPVRWEIDAQAPFSCAASIELPKYNISKRLVKGLNTIEFTPKETGRLPFSCSMGMYTGVFNVVDENGQGIASNDAAIQSAASSDGSCGISGGCGGANTSANTGGCGGSAPSANSSGGGCGCGGCGCGGGTKFTPDTGTVANSADTSNNSAKGEQVVTSGFAVRTDIQPNTFTVKAGIPVKYIINPAEDGLGCMYAIMIPGLWEDPITIKANKQIVMKFTPEIPGQYPITCGMGMQRGLLIVEN